MTVPDPTAAPSTLVLIDGHALTFRSLYAMRRGDAHTPRLTNRDGEATDAIVGFMRTLLRLARPTEHQVVVVFDAPHKTFRHDKWEKYKAGRNAAPADFAGQLRRIQQLVDALGFPRVEREGYEADDVIASLTRAARKRQMEVRILTSDHDVYQLLGDGVKVISSDFSLYGAEDVQAEYEVGVDKWVDFRSLTGDSSDNIPGAKGIGKKTAAKLLAEYGSLEDIYIAADEGTLKPDGARKKLLESRENVQLSQALSRMVDTLEIDIPWGVRRGSGNPEEVTELIAELQLQGLKKDLLAVEKVEDEETENAYPPTQPFVLKDWKSPKDDGEYWWGYQLSTEHDLSASLVAAAYTETEKVTETEWSTFFAPAELAKRVEQPSLFAAEMSPESEKPVRKTRKTSKSSKGTEVQPEVMAHWWQNQPRVCAADAKALATHLGVRGIDIEPHHDPLLCAYLLDPSNTDMKVTCKRYLGCDWPEDAAARAVLSAQLWSLIWEKLDETGKQLYTELELPLSVVLARMEVRGVSIDSAFFRALSGAAEQTLTRLEGQIQELAGETFVVRSPKQLETILYDKLGLASRKKTKTKQRSTAVASLEPLREEHPIIPLILEYRELDKLRGTYLEPLPSLVNTHTKRLHTTFSQTSVATGRLSSLNPNLQNIPIRSEMGRELRKGFIAPVGHKLISADYSQIELRLLAHISGDPIMQQAFRDGADIHRRTAARVMNIPEENVTSEQRRAAKTVNFGVLYGMSAHRLSQSLGISFKAASDFIEGYFATYPKIQEYINETLSFGREHGYVQTIYGRKRYVPELNATSRVLKEAGERLAYNMPIQGTAADIMKMAMIRLERELEGTSGRLLLQVHDELLLEAPQAETETIANITKRVMETVVQLDVPLSVEVGIGDNWLETK